MLAQGRNILYIYLSEHATSSRSSWLYVFLAFNQHHMEDSIVIFIVATAVVDFV